jgi:hypothetical protein
VDFEPGELVERRYGRDESQFGRITGRVHEGYDTWYVTTGMGMTYCDNGRDLRRAGSASDQNARHQV